MFSDFFFFPILVPGNWGKKKLAVPEITQLFISIPKEHWRFLPKWTEQWDVVKFANVHDHLHEAIFKYLYHLLRSHILSVNLQALSHSPLIVTHTTFWPLAATHVLLL